MKTIAVAMLIILGGFYLVYLGAERSGKDMKDCEGRGGYALVERGVFKDCLVGVKSIK